MGITEGTQVLQAGIDAQQTACCLNLCDWEAIGPSDVYLKFHDTLTGGFIKNPDTDITHDSRQVFGRENRLGLLLGLRMRYNSGVVEIPVVVVKVFARTRDAAGTAGLWQILRNRQGDASVQIIGDLSDIIIGDNLATTADPEAHYFDTQGCNEFLVGVETELTGDFDIGILDAKFIS